MLEIVTAALWAEKSWQRSRKEALKFEKTVFLAAPDTGNSVDCLFLIAITVAAWENEKLGGFLG